MDKGIQEGRVVDRTRFGDRGDFVSLQDAFDRDLELLARPGVRDPLTTITSSGTTRDDTASRIRPKMRSRSASSRSA